MALLRVALALTSTSLATAILVRDQDKQFSLRVPSDSTLLDAQAINVQSTTLVPALEIAGEASDGVSAAESEGGGVVAVAITADLEAGSLHIEPSVGPSAAAAAVADASRGRVPVAWGTYNNTLTQTGWSFLYVGTTDDPRISDEAKLYAAGYLEGFVSAKMIRDFQHNANVLLMRDERQHHALDNIRDRFNKEIEMVRNKAGMVAGSVLSKATAPDDPWWRQARYALLQTWGVLDAYNQQADRVKGKPMSLVDMIILNSDGETPELEAAYDRETVLVRESQVNEPIDGAVGGRNSFLQRRVAHRDSERSPSARSKNRHSDSRLLANLDDAAWRRIKSSTGRCSALIRLAPENQDLMVGHTTFSDYSEMTRIFKYYDLPLEGSSTRRMGFSSYPGVVGSTDDYYLMDTGLVVTETTVSMLSDEPYDKLDDQRLSVPDFMRIMMANRLASSAKEWVEYMQSSASGTYSSQWMVVDYNKFSPGEDLRDGAFYVVEQVPGVTHAEDMTRRLQEQRFWASENRAWFKDVRDAAGATEAEELHGDLFSADRNPRAHIFAATVPEIASLAGMRDEMQRNRWPNEVDGGVANTPDHAIAARGDLDRQNPNPNGAVDSKVTSACLVKKLQCDAISGPTHESQKPFKWTDSSGRELYPGAPHDGLPDLWNFDWVRMAPEGEGPLFDC